MQPIHKQDRVRWLPRLVIVATLAASGISPLTSAADELVLGWLETSYGDANLDGTVDGGDFTHWSLNRLAGDTGWAAWRWPTSATSPTAITITGAAVAYERAVAQAEARLRRALSTHPKAREAQEEHDRHLSMIHQACETEKEAIFRSFARARRKPRVKR